MDVEQLAAGFAVHRRVHVADFLAQDCAAALHGHLVESQDWHLVVNHGDRVIELDRETRSALTEQQRQYLELGVAHAALHGFQFKFETIRVPDEESDRKARPTLLNEFASFLSSQQMIGWLRSVTGWQAIDFADAQATSYGAGDFLTPHDDDVEGKRRRAAYVLNLTPEWRPEWGGILLFHGEDGHVERGFVPSFNCLSLFGVPAAHSVSQVASFVPHRRLSITGWLRSRG